MTLSLIDVGTTANDGTGDPLRTAFQTVNTALTAVNNAVVVGTGVTTFKDDSGSAGVSVLSSGDVTFSKLGSGDTAGTVTMGGGDDSADGGGITLYGSTTTLGSTILFRRDTVNYMRFYPTGDVRTYQDDGSTLGMKWTASVSAPKLECWSDVGYYGTGGTTGIYFDASARSGVGALGIETTGPTTALDINSDIMRLRSSNTPANAAASGSVGMICWDINYLYICTATNTWRRVAHSTW